MKLSEIIPKWPQKKEIQQTQSNERQRELNAYNFALTSCDREIDREALKEALVDFYHAYKSNETWISDDINKFISTMPQWLKRTDNGKISS